MAKAYPHNPLTAMADLVARVGPYDPSTGDEVTTVVTMTIGDQTATFPLSAYLSSALYEALINYHDPSDVGPCDNCGRPGLDQNLQCRHCGHISGVFGQVLLEHAERLRQTERGVESG